PAKRKMPKSMLGRASKLFSMGVKFAAKEAANKISHELGKHPEARWASRLKAIEDLVAGLGELKGAAMKAGQMLSIEFSDWFPEEINQHLRKLQSSTSFMPWKEVAKILEREFGQDWQ